MNELCLQVTGKDARQVAVLAILEDVEQGALKTLPVSNREAIAALIGGRVDEASLKVAAMILGLADRTQDDPFSG
jgi:hypothetical protein